MSLCVWSTCHAKPILIMNPPPHFQIHYVFSLPHPLTALSSLIPVCHVSSWGWLGGCFRCLFSALHKPSAGKPAAWHINIFTPSPFSYVAWWYLMKVEFIHYPHCVLIWSQDKQGHQTDITTLCNTRLTDGSRLQHLVLDYKMMLHLCRLSYSSL